MVRENSIINSSLNSVGRVILFNNNVMGSNPIEKTMF